MGYVPPVLPSGFLYAPSANVSPEDFEAFRRAWYANVGRPQMVVVKPPALSLSDGYRTPDRPSMDFYHLMNTGLLFSIIALIVSILYLGLMSA